MVRQGYYSFEHPKGAFNVYVLPSGVFRSEDYVTNSKWEIVDGRLMVDFGKFGVYSFDVSNPNEFVGKYFVAWYFFNIFIRFCCQ